MANEFDKLYSLQQIELWLAHPEQCSPRIRNDILKQLADVMRENEKLKADLRSLMPRETYEAEQPDKED